MVINVIILLIIGGHFINGYWWLFNYKPLVVILLVVIVRQLLSLYSRFYKVTMLENTNITSEKKMQVYF